MKSAVILVLALSTIATKKAAEVHYHYHGLSHDAIAKHDFFSNKDKAHCTYNKKSSKWNLFAKKEGWNCNENWDKCVKKCDTAGCTWVCTKSIPKKNHRAQVEEKKPEENKSDS